MPMPAPSPSSRPRRPNAMMAVTLLFAIACTAGVWLLVRNSGKPSAPSTTELEVPEQGYNVIHIVVDSLRYDHLGVYGYERDASPNIDAFADNAVVFDDHISQCSWTLPSHATMFSGLYPSAHGVDHNFERIRDDATTLALVLQQAGYQTAGFSCAPLLEKRYGIQRGFDTYDDTLSSDTKKKSWRTITSRKMVNKVLDTIENREKDRFYVFMHMWDVHYDYNPPTAYEGTYTAGYDGDIEPFHWVKDREQRPVPPQRDQDYIVGLYDEELLWVDHSLGRLFDKLDKMGIMDETVILITSDHGEEFWEHGLTCHNHSLYEDQIHVPFILAVPGQQGQVRVPCRTAMVDLFPTVLDLAGVDAPPDWPLQGYSMLPLIRGERECDTERPILSETVWSRHGSALNGKKGYEIAMYRGRYKISRRLEPPTQDFLFDLEEDPREYRNLRDSHPELFEEMSLQMNEMARQNAQIHDDIVFSRHKKLSKETVDTLRALGYVDD